MLYAKIVTTMKQEMIDALDSEAERRETSRAHLIRKACAKLLTALQKEEINDEQH